MFCPQGPRVLSIQNVFVVENSGAGPLAGAPLQGGEVVIAGNNGYSFTHDKDR